MEFDVDAIVEIDRLNMAHIFTASGGKFDPQFRRDRILIELEEGATFLCIHKLGQLVAYLEIMNEPGELCYVMSIQIHPSNQHGSILRSLLSAAYEQLEVGTPKEIKTSVHFNNFRSVNLHRKLGFKETRREGDRILFRIEGKHLLQRLARYKTNGTANIKTFNARPGTRDGLFS
ncbi:MAG: GNAT family N-acetyltransferase [Sedimentisphaerales bacterium]|jgi:ribosomal protein S18 acetylase RimI-like enzyme